MRASCCWRPACWAWAFFFVLTSFAGLGGSRFGAIAASPTSGANVPGGLSEAQTKEIARLLDLHNAVRARNGLKPLRLSAALCGVGQSFAHFMETTGRFSHTADGKEPKDRIVAAGYRFASCAENIAMGPRSADEAVTMWIESKGHYANMLGGYTEIGFGRSGRMWVAVFATPAN